MKKQKTYLARIALIGTVGLCTAWFALPDENGYVPPQATAAAEAPPAPTPDVEPDVAVDPAPAPQTEPVEEPAPEPAGEPTTEDEITLEEVEIDAPPKVEAQSLPTSATQKEEPAKPAPAKAERWTEDQAVRAVEKYFRASETLRATFTQYAPDGTRSTGVLSLKRPGRVRFEYDAPSPLLIIADGVWITLADTEMDTVDRYPVSATPLGVILQDDKNLRKEAIVTGFYQDEDRFELIVRARENPGLGRLSLKLTKNPVALDGWAVEDAQGLVTEIRLADMKSGVTLEPSLFHISDIKKPRGR